MVQVKDLTQLKVPDLWKEVKGEDDWWGDVKADTVRLVKGLLEGTMEEEIVAQLQVVRYGRARDRRGYRNGYRHRSLLTEFGLLDGIRVPRDRDSLYQPGVIERYQRRQEGVNRRWCRRCFSMGSARERYKKSWSHSWAMGSVPRRFPGLLVSWM